MSPVIYIHILKGQIKKPNFSDQFHFNMQNVYTLSHVVQMEYAERVQYRNDHKPFGKLPYKISIQRTNWKLLLIS